ncbi:MAG: serine/threonine-protein kinase [Verrucomicrobiales bacterium]
MMPEDIHDSLAGDATFAGRAKRQPADVSLGDERTLGDGMSAQDTIIDEIEVVDLDTRYRLEGTLGQGGMGAVLLATDTRLDRKVAIKRILGEAAGNRMAVQRFLTEAKAIAALNHPNIVQIYDYGRAKDGPFLIMEFVDGGSLLDRCREGAMPLEAAVDMACQLCDGLAKAHDLGIVHRDIKPANVLLTKDGTPKLTDFGLAKAQAEGKPYVVVKNGWSRDETGAKQRVQKEKIVRPWWWNDGPSLSLVIRYGARPLELSRGKRAITVANLAAIPATLGTVIEATRQGELDASIEATVAASKSKSKT